MVVTGAAGGIGLGAGRAFGRAGYSVVAADIDGDRLEAASMDLARAGVDVHARVCDVRDAGSMAELANDVLDRFGRADVVCLNAGGPVPRASFEVTPEDWERDLSLNLFSVIQGVNVFVPVMDRQGHGHINATSSMSGLVPFPPVVTYNVAKAGVIAYMETVARELADRGSLVTVSVLCPGEVATRGVENAMRQALSEGHRPSTHEQAVAEAAQASILERGMDPDAVGEALVQGVEEGRFWIFTHTEWVEGPLQRHHEAMSRDGQLPDL